MFKLISKVALMASLFLVLTGCVSLPMAKTHPSYDVPQVEMVQIELALAPIEIKAPVMEVRELPVPVKALHERANFAFTEKEIQCMARNLYFEARGEGSVGMAGVGYTVLNRVATRGYPKSICGVVHQPGQFSWVKKGRNNVIRNQASYAHAREIAIAVMTGTIENPIDDSIFFNHKSLRPSHTRTAALRASLGNHRFYAALR